MIKWTRTLKWRGTQRSRDASENLRKERSSWSLGPKPDAASLGGMSVPVGFHSEALGESAAAERWYRERSDSATNG